jgi:hypothetical protein
MEGLYNEIRSFGSTYSIIVPEAGMKVDRILIVIGGALLIIGARLPWISVPALFGVEGPAYEAIEIGWEGDGFMTGGIGLILLLGALLIKRRHESRYSLASAILASLALLGVIADMRRVFEIGPDQGFFAATDVGLYVTFLGASIALVGALLRYPIELGAQPVPRNSGLV